VGITLWLGFFFCRVLNSSYIIFYKWPRHYRELIEHSNHTVHAAMLLTVLCVSALNFYWFFLISKGVVRALTRGSSSSSSSSSAAAAANKKKD
jgi:hypothetical protein